MRLAPRHLGSARSQAAKAPHARRRCPFRGTFLGTPDRRPSALLSSVGATRGAHPPLLVARRRLKIVFSSGGLARAIHGAEQQTLGGDDARGAASVDATVDIRRDRTQGVGNTD